MIPINLTSDRVQTAHAPAAPVHMYVQPILAVAFFHLVPIAVVPFVKCTVSFT